MTPVAEPPGQVPQPGASKTSESHELQTSTRRSVLRTIVWAGLAVVAAALGLRGTGGSSKSPHTAAPLPSPSATLAPLPADPAVTTPGLSPLVTPTADFYRIDIASTVPEMDASSWQLTIDGMVASPQTLRYSDLVAIGLVEMDATLSCVSNPIGGHEIGTARWTGVRLRDVLDLAGVDPAAEQVFSYGADDFTAGFPIAAAQSPDALIALGMNGQPLLSEHGYPARLVVPGQYGYVSATKWLTRIELATWGGRNGFWIPRGWSKLGPAKAGSRIDTPTQGSTVHSGQVTVAGMAWCPGGSPSRVQVRVNKGPWVNCDLGPVLSEHSWRQWWTTVSVESGRSTLEVRGYDADGSVQTSLRAPEEPDGATGLHSVVITVV